MKRTHQNTALAWVLVPLIAIPLVVLTIALLFWSNDKDQTVADDNQDAKSNIFSTHYPVAKKFKAELEYMRTTGRLKTEDEILIHKMVMKAASSVDMPPGILWCLLFQESRLNHLLGLAGDRGARGVGQFTFYGFREINRELDRYATGNLDMFINTLGTDIRPIAPLKDDVYHPSSYFYIPTAVASSAAFLNNRYHQLKRNLERRKIKYDEGLLWLYAAMAYNKGTRAVLTFWNQARATGGQKLVEQYVRDPDTFFKSFKDSQRFREALSRIWKRDTAKHYAKELTIHMKQLKACSVESESRMNASTKSARR